MSIPDRSCLFHDRAGRFCRVALIPEPLQKLVRQFRLLSPSDGVRDESAVPDRLTGALSLNHEQTGRRHLLIVPEPRLQVCGGRTAVGVYAAMGRNARIPLDPELSLERCVSRSPRSEQETL